MSSLYQIQNDILRIFDEVESNDGEITEEQSNALTIKEDELKTKLDSYVKAIKSWEVDEKALKDEKKRFNDRQNIFKNRIERLKKAALEAVLTFGEHGKNNMFIELPTFRLFTKNSSSVEVDEQRVHIFMEEFERYIRELVSAGVLYAGKDVDLSGILSAINANCRATYGDDFEEFTINDLMALHITISQTNSIYDFFKSGLALNMYGQEPVYTKMENATTKEDWKTIINASNIGNTPTPTMAKVVTNVSLQIK